MRFDFRSDVDDVAEAGCGLSDLLGVYGDHASDWPSAIELDLSCLADSL
jgi:hypothetical protein